MGTGWSLIVPDSNGKGNKTGLFFYPCPFLKENSQIGSHKLPGHNVR